MLIERPIFVNGFSRGGTTILTNLLGSHPDVCFMGETHHVFKGTSISDSIWDVVRKCLVYDAPIIFGQRQNFFSPRLVKSRRPLQAASARRIDQVLHREKLRSTHPLLNRYKGPGQRYTAQELSAARLLCKNIDGMVYTSDAWGAMYPRATYFGLVRNGLALCEGHVRRGRSAAEIGWRFQVLVDKMLHDAARLPNYKMIRFEDLLAAPRQTMESACTHAQLDPSSIKHVRMQARRVMDADGNHRLLGRHAEWDVSWLRVEELDSYFQKDVDRNQIKRLSGADKAQFLRQAGDAMHRLGYADEDVADTVRQTDSDNFLLPFRRPMPAAGEPSRRRAA